MKLVTVKQRDGSKRSGWLEGNAVHLFSAGGGDDALAAIAGPPREPSETVSLDEVALLAPLLSPPRIFGVGLNYVEHAAETKMKVQQVPTVFMKLTESIIGPDSDVLLPAEAVNPDYEAELGVVVGRGGYRISEGDWEDHVFGYTIVNDISARGPQLATTQWTLGKSLPTFTPMGPYIVTKDEVGDPHMLNIRLTLAGETMQSANTCDLIFRVPALIAYISSLVPLLAGDVISTGTPPGVGLGRSPQRWLRDDEEMIIEIEKLGVLRNRTRFTAAP